MKTIYLVVLFTLPSIIHASKSPSQGSAQPSSQSAATSNEDKSVGPVFVREPLNRVDFSNTTGAVVECGARGMPPPEIIWVRADGTAVGDVPGLRQVLANGNLVFPPFRAEDYRQEVHAQVYSCMAKNSVGTVYSRDVNVRAVVNQFYKAEILTEYVIRGNTAVLKCSIPSFVADFVHVEAWIDDDGNELKLAQSNYGFFKKLYEEVISSNRIIQAKNPFRPIYGNRISGVNQPFPVRVPHW